MKKFLLPIIFIFITMQLLYSLPYNNSRNLAETEVLVSGGLYLDSNMNYGALGLLEYGASSYFLPIIKIGYLKSDKGSFYAGLESKIIITKNFGGIDYLSLNLGGHYYNNMGIDFSILSGNLYKNIDIYMGLDFDIDFADSIEYPANFIIGTLLKPFRGREGVLIEIGIPITSYSYYQLGCAVRFSL